MLMAGDSLIGVSVAISMRSPPVASLMQACNVVLQGAAPGHVRVTADAGGDTADRLSNRKATGKLGLNGRMTEYSRWVFTVTIEIRGLKGTQPLEMCGLAPAFDANRSPLSSAHHANVPRSARTCFSSKAAVASPGAIASPTT